MIKIACLCLAIATVQPLWSQVEPSATGGPAGLDDTRMMTPPPVSGGAYPGNVGSEARENFVSVGMVVTGAYLDNIMEDPSRKIGDSEFSFAPTIAIDRRTSRDSASLRYTAGFNMYRKTTGLNGATQDLSSEYKFHLARYAVVEIRDSFYQNNNLFNQANPFTGGSVSTGAPSPTAIYVYPFENSRGNSLAGGVEYQYSRNAMIGAGGNYSLLRYSSLSNITGLDNSNTGGGSAFWSRRILHRQYLGTIYDYSKITTDPVKTTTDTHAILGFYTLFFTRTISFSILGGPQHFNSRATASGAASGSWTPEVHASAGVQTMRTGFAGGYSRIVSGAGGLIGAFHSDVAGLEVRRQVTRTWNVGATANYALFKNVTPTVSSNNPGGHTIVGTISARRTFNVGLGLEAGYSRFHQSYYNPGSVRQLYPDCNREFVSVTYQFQRPLGR